MKGIEAIPRMEKGEKFYIEHYGKYFDNGEPRWFTIKDGLFFCAGGYEPEIRQNLILHAEWLPWHEEPESEE